MKVDCIECRQNTMELCSENICDDEGNVVEVYYFYCRNCFFRSINSYSELEAVEDITDPYAY